jgi:Spy/CpxP family protein refolding chaperone
VNTWKAILAAMVIFGAGLVTGAVWIHVADNPRPGANPPPRNNSGTPRQSLPLEQLRKVELMMRVQKDLNLSPEQREHIEKIIGDGQDRIRDLWDQVAPEIYDEFEDVKQKLCAELTPEQNKRFAELMKQQQHQHKPATTNAAPAKVTSDNKP